MTSPYNPSLLHARLPVGFRLVGTAAQPLMIRAYEGWRVYPGSTVPVRQKMPDGSWLDVLWTPSVG